MTEATSQAEKPKITEVTINLLKMLTPFDCIERKRILTATLALLGDMELTSDFDHAAGGQTKNKSLQTTPSFNGKFFTRFNHDKPSDNALLVAAYHYAKYGRAPFSVDEVRTIAESEAGLTVPSRLDMTYKAAMRGGKKLFASSGRGQFKPTVHGENYFRETYNVQKGTIAKVEEASKT